MRQVRIKKLSVENFKGLRNFSIDFDDKLTRIIGSNGTGKTTLHDAYLWLLMGMDSGNRKSFSVQPLDESSETIHHLTTSVTGVFEFGDGSVHEFKRSLSETYTRRRGTKSDVLTGTETERFIDNVPYKAGDFDKAVVTMFCDMDDFELVSSIRAFGKLDMKAKRNKLIDMAGQMPELINSTDYPKLYEHYRTTPNVDDIKRKLMYELAQLKDEQTAIPIRITENERNMPTGINFDDLRSQKAEAEEEIEKIDATLQKAADGRSGLFSEIQRLNDDLQKANAELLEIDQSLSQSRSKKLSEVEAELSSASLSVREIDGKMRIVDNELAQLEETMASLKKRKDELGEKWEKKNAESWPDTIEIECPTCHRPYDPDKVQEMRNAAIKAFNEGKAGVLARIVSEGNLVVKQLDSIKNDIECKKAEHSSLKHQLEEAKARESDARRKVSEVPTLDILRSVNKEYQTVSARKDSIRQMIFEQTPKENESELRLKNRKEQLKRDVDTLTYELAKERKIAEVEARRDELKRHNAELSNRIAEIYSVLYEIQTYQKAYINAVEEKVSSMFKLVRWKMYQPNVSNDGEQEICECLVNGVPVSTNVNTAGSVNAGIDIINALSRWLDISVPLWIDGKESVTDLIDTDAQLITLSVVENHPLSIL